MKTREEKLNPFNPPTLPMRSEFNNSVALPVQRANLTHREPPAILQMSLQIDQPRYPGPVSVRSILTNPTYHSSGIVGGIVIIIGAHTRP
jgi:hypothetical protein